MRHPRKFQRGDCVVRRPGTLGNMDGKGPFGIVMQSAVEVRTGDEIVRVAFPGHTETFIADIYVKVSGPGSDLDSCANTGWANAHRIADDHHQEVTNLGTQAQTAAHRASKGKISDGQ